MVMKRVLPVVTVVAVLLVGINVATAQSTTADPFAPGLFDPGNGPILYQFEDDEAEFGEPTAPGLVDIDEQPFAIDAAFRWSYFDDGENFDFNTFGGEINFDVAIPIAGDNLFEVGLVTYIAGTNLDLVDAVFWDIQAAFGLAFPVELENEMVFSVVVDARVGFGLLHIDGPTGTSDLYYLPIEGSIGPRLYFNNSQFIFINAVIGGHIGVDSDDGPTPEDLFDIGATLGVGTRF